jgi:integrase
MQEGLVEANPVVGTRKPQSSQPRTRVLSNSELVMVWNACDDGEAQDDYDRILRLLILTGCRRQEIGGMRRSELDLNAGTWALPAARSKNHREHVLPLSPLALDIVRTADALASLNGREPLFGVRGDRGYTDWDRSRAAFDLRLGDAVKPWRLHDLRRTTATRMADIGIEPHIIENILNHRSGHKRGVAGIYNMSIYERATRAALLRWSEHVRGLVEGQAEDRATIVQLRATA